MVQALVLLDFHTVTVFFLVVRKSFDIKPLRGSLNGEFRILFSEKRVIVHLTFDTSCTLLYFSVLLSNFLEATKDY